MEFRQLEVFVAVAEYKSFSKAAESLYLTQSTTSSHIRNLEKELQKQLISRTNKYLQLTPDGKKFLHYAQRILETRDAALAELNEPGDQLLRLGASTIPSGYLLPAILKGFRKLHPGAHFIIRQGDSSEILEQILDGSIELGFVGSPDKTGKCSCIPFCEDELVIAMPATEHYLSLQKKGFRLETLLKEPIILREPGSGTQKSSDQFLSSAHISRKMLNTIAEVNDLEMIRHFLLNGSGITICSRFSVDDLEKSGQVILYHPDSDIHRNFYLVWLKSRTLRPPLTALIQYTQETAAFTLRTFSDKDQLPDRYRQTQVSSDKRK